MGILDDAAAALRGTGASRAQRRAAGGKKQPYFTWTHAGGYDCRVAKLGAGVWRWTIYDLRGPQDDKTLVKEEHGETATKGTAMAAANQQGDRWVAQAD